MQAQPSSKLISKLHPGQSSKKLKFMNGLTNRVKKGDVWSAVKYKRGNPDGKTG